MDSAELSDWRHFLASEPQDPERMDYRFAQLITTVENLLRKKEERLSVKEVMDAYFSFTPKPRRPIAQVEADLRLYFRMHNEAVRRSKERGKKKRQKGSS